MPVLARLLHYFRLAIAIGFPVPGTSLRVASDSLTDLKVIAGDWADLPRLQAWIAERRYGGVYLLVGRRNGRVRVRIGEGVKLWTRLGDHKADPQLDFVEEVYVLVSPSFHKGATVYLQEQLSEIVQAEPALDSHKGCGPLTGFPLGDADRKSLDLAVLLGLNLFHAAGLRILQPSQSRLARQVAALLAEAA
ncbi:hypothetical protein CIW48_22430 [Methylobacterium sp. P1-11]|uniref:hypothetical protein n=1 Tax=Methylobacterium sp. P1-11 TaxID=2024616 RepID=UPI0011EF35DF|nr:hypothetical protein [Methylobacterium sp. P1-11]KAA0121725.1 hypothetical protein CIW48_22430 [Methylobacterium sp. P1-11]